MRIRKMSEMSRSPSVGGSITTIPTIPTQPSDINSAFAKLVVNLHRIKSCQPIIPLDSHVKSFRVTDCKKSAGDLSTTCRVSVQLQSDRLAYDYVFIAKLLPADDPNRVHVFESNVFEKEICIYFELLPCLRQVCVGTKLEAAMRNSIPQCLYGSNNCDRAGVLAFECAEENGFVHPDDPEGLSLDQVLCIVTFMAKFHAVASSLLMTRGESSNNGSSERATRSTHGGTPWSKERFPFLCSNVYSTPMMQEGARRMFKIYAEFLQSVSGDEQLQVKFARYCDPEEGGPTEMFTCLRRQVDSPFNTIIHGELWEKNMLFRHQASPSNHKEDDQDIRSSNTSNQGSELETIVLDWKNAKVASATKDLAFLLLSSTTHELRKASLDLILRTYHRIFCESLEMLGCNVQKCHGLSYKEFFADYAVSTKGAFLQAICVLMQEMTFMGDKADYDESAEHTLTVYERRALNLMKDDVLSATHFAGN